MGGAARVVQQPSLAATALCWGLWLSRQPPLRGDWRSAALRVHLIVTAVLSVHGRAPHPQPQAAGPHGGMDRSESLLDADVTHTIVSPVFAAPTFRANGDGDSLELPRKLLLLSHYDLPYAFLGRAATCLGRGSLIVEPILSTPRSSGRRPAGFGQRTL